MSGRIDLTGQRFGRLTVLRRDHRHYWRCRCECGHETVARCDHLATGRTQSCGCLARVLASRRRLHHGASIGKERNPHYHEYAAWLRIRQRCYNPSCREYRYYGGRGIGLAPEWRDDFAAFLAGVGKRPSLQASLDRIDNSRGYEPGNVRWTDRQTQMNNTRRNRRLTWNGETLTLTQWSRRLGCNIGMLYARANAGWSTERILTTPTRVWPSQRAQSC
jgi:hypothetical protein